jgi:hypothetical protein
MVADEFSHFIGWIIGKVAGRHSSFDDDIQLQARNNIVKASTPNPTPPKKP